MSGIQIFKIVLRRKLYEQKQEINCLYNDLFLLPFMRGHLMRGSHHFHLNDNFYKLSECKRKLIINLLKIAKLLYKRNSRDLYDKSEFDDSIDYGFNDCKKIVSLTDYMCHREASISFSSISFYLGNTFTNPMSSYIRDK